MAAARIQRLRGQELNLYKPKKLDGVNIATWQLVRQCIKLFSADISANESEGLFNFFLGFFLQNSLKRKKKCKSKSYVFGYKKKSGPR